MGFFAGPEAPGRGCAYQGDQLGVLAVRLRKRAARQQ